MFIFYFVLGIMNALALSAYPLIYLDKGYSSEKVALLISLSFFAMILQPVVGMFNQLFIAKVYGITETTTSVYIIVIAMMCIGLVPVLSFKKVSGE